MSRRRKRRSPGRWFLDGWGYFRTGLEQPSSDLSAKLNVAVWSVLLLSTMARVTTSVLTQDWGATMWVNGFWAVVQGALLRWSLHGRLYRKEIQAKEAEEQRFLEVLKGGYGINDRKRSN